MTYISQPLCPCKKSKSGEEPAVGRSSTIAGKLCVFMSKPYYNSVISRGDTIFVCFWHAFENSRNSLTNVGTKQLTNSIIRMKSRLCRGKTFNEDVIKWRLPRWFMINLKHFFFDNLCQWLQIVSSAWETSTYSVLYGKTNCFAKQHLSPNMDRLFHTFIANICISNG